MFITQNILHNIRKLLKKEIDTKSSYLAESLAFGYGFNTSIALLNSIKNNNQIYIHNINRILFFDRLRQLDKNITIDKYEQITNLLLKTLKNISKHPNTNYIVINEDKTFRKDFIKKRYYENKPCLYFDLTDDFKIVEDNNVIDFSFPDAVKLNVIKHLTDNDIIFLIYSLLINNITDSILKKDIYNLLSVIIKKHFLNHKKEINSILKYIEDYEDTNSNALLHIKLNIVFLRKVFSKYFNVDYNDSIGFDDIIKKKTIIHYPSLKISGDELIFLGGFINKSFQLYLNNYNDKNLNIIFNNVGYIEDCIVDLSQKYNLLYLCCDIKSLAKINAKFEKDILGKFILK